MSAKHSWTLLRIFPLMTREKFANNEYLNHFVQLHEIWRLVLCEEYDSEIIEELRVKIDAYLRNWKRLYPNDELKPKQHL